MPSRALVAAFSLLIALPAFAQNNIFITSPQYPTTIGPFSVAVGDFNADGKPDLAVLDGCPSSGCAAGAGGSVSILLGNGDGTFQPHVDYSLPYGAANNAPLSIAVADFNGDGKLDLAVADYLVVSIFFGNGDGTFQPHVDYGTAGYSTSVAVGDFNGDGKPDLVVGSPGSLSIFLNSGTGTFPTRTDITTVSGASPLAVGDFNKDGKQDLAVVTTCASTGCVDILLGNGDGAFSTAKSRAPSPLRSATAM